ncbi:MAG: hypothetical protein K2X77_11465 [Candidatus Obscuribacterales bacterium]|nr:hypothetical protein [Candidatus Obscuribacterales bacterium]
MLSTNKPILLGLALSCIVGIINPTVAADESVIPTGWEMKGSRPNDYLVMIDPQQKRDGKPILIMQSKTSPIDGFGTVMQKISTEKYLGKRLRFSADVKSENVVDAAGIWMRVDAGSGNTIALDNMEKRPIKGNNDWKNYSVVLDVSPRGTQVCIGILTHSTGKIWVSNLKLEEVGKDVPVTDILNKDENPTAPVNLDFTQGTNK